ncbi:MAG: hypothetical protein QNJ97_17705 [Myxococcota bacterium]|nr:hypothetical protein [Myxococcota bacterium]
MSNMSPWFGFILIGIMTLWLIKSFLDNPLPVIIVLALVAVAIAGGEAYGSGHTVPQVPRYDTQGGHGHGPLPGRLGGAGPGPGDLHAGLRQAGPVRP